jgi:chloramphenicol 3-O-phosphotransferase
VGRSCARLGLSRRRSRVRVPSLPLRNVLQVNEFRGPPVSCRTWPTPEKRQNVRRSWSSHHARAASRRGASARPTAEPAGNEGRTVIVLNGASSSGKGRLARALQESLDDLFLHVEMDFVFEAMEVAGYNGAVQLGETVPPKLARGAVYVHDNGNFVRIEYGEEGRRGFQGFFAMVAGLAEEQNNLIVDAFSEEPWMIPGGEARRAPGLPGWCSVSDGGARASRA